MNPYKDCDFLQFMTIFFSRLHLMFSPQKLVDDEIQVWILLLLGSACIIVGMFLILQKKLLVANAISHTILLGIIAAVAFLRLTTQQPLIFDHHFSLQNLLLPAVLSAIFTQVLTDFLSKKLRFQEDASIGAAFTFLFALSIFLVSLSGRNSHLGLESVTGNLDAVTLEDLTSAFQVLLLSIAWVLLFFPRYCLLSFDEGFSQAIGIKRTFYHGMLMVLSALVLMSGFKSVGVIMVLALMCFPLMTAWLFVKNIPKAFAIGFAQNGCLALISVATSRSLLNLYQLPVSTAGVFVTLSGILFLIAWQSSNAKNRLANKTKPL
jgi:manganese/zinc/iron transport system permease protein